MGMIFPLNRHCQIFDAKVGRVVLTCLLWVVMFSGSSFAKTPAQWAEAVRDAAANLLETSEVTYALGGSRVGTADECARCNGCLAGSGTWALKGSAKLEACPDCRACALDCSHFIQLVFSMAGMSSAYLTTQEMAAQDAGQLRSRYGWIDVGGAPNVAREGDVLVYQGHAVILERVSGEGRGDIIHATSGLVLKGPGAGIQRERFVEIASFRGPLLRVLRRVEMRRGGEKPPLGRVLYIDDLQKVGTDEVIPAPTSTPHPRLRKISS
jgi:cell wall-associated NlpC family hydrolase